MRTTLDSPRVWVLAEDATLRYALGSAVQGMRGAALDGCFSSVGDLCTAAAASRPRLLIADAATLGGATDAAADLISGVRLLLVDAATEDVPSWIRRSGVCGILPPGATPAAVVIGLCAALMGLSFFPAAELSGYVLTRERRGRGAGNHAIG